MRLVLLGPPMAGKGTQASILAERFGLLHIAMGDLLRDAVAADTSLGRKAKKYMDAGALVPDAIVIGLIEGKLKTTNSEKGFILDGFPRTVAQAKQLEEFTDVDLVLCLEIAFNRLVERATGRRICRSCGAVYHIKNNPPKKPNVCDRDQDKLYRRNDDNAKVVQERLRAYEAQTQPVIDYYSSREKLKFVDSDVSIEEVGNRLVNTIRDRWPYLETEIKSAPEQEAAPSAEPLKKKEARTGRGTRRQHGRGRRGNVGKRKGIRGS